MILGAIIVEVHKTIEIHSKSINHLLHWTPRDLPRGVDRVRFSIENTIVKFHKKSIIQDQNDQHSSPLSMLQQSLLQISLCYHLVHILLRTNEE